MSKLLLKEGTPAVALAIASGEWFANPEREVKAELRSIWPQVILDSSSLEFDRIEEGKWLPDILASNPEIAVGWMTRYFNQSSPGPRYPPEELKQVVAALSDAQLSRLLDELDRDHLFFKEWAALLVDGRAGLLSHLTGSDDSSDVQLAALAEQELGHRWWELAMIALEAGIAPARIAANAFDSSPGFWGYGEEHWSKYREFFSSRLPVSDSSAREMCEAGIELADQRLADASERKRQDDLYGRR